ncbi:RNA polymerase sigma-70 factor, ECF subfamily [Prauserella marina]|uniref:RNA polymerase sigma-70 factor, ECF subfamily n=1 Tax=Prauserella marina TaxID=530584 RepID=A0A1G6NYA0_9PSEU|nr:sigma-70 family RNA polymerase sigma factor [Prauserella marina]PWV82569.1 RNA polymerase sigma-70 factor (ECF subfamily) [Prauserella marina]SDC72207.1 RNA polymerase sigma-70 factor, ECF subfamily [Prauserella marina]
MSMPIAVAAGPAPARRRKADRAIEAAAPFENTDTHQEIDSAAEAAVAENWELVHAAQRGDTAAFGKLYDRYVDWVFRYVLLRVGDRHLAEDVTSETFLRALRRITSISYQGRDVGAWFTTIARNLVFDHVKSSRFRLEIVTDEVSESGAPPFGGGTPSAPQGPEQQVISKTTNDELLRCIADLGDDQRECVILRFIQGFSVSETAAIMQRNEGAVKALQHRAVRRLAKLLPSGLR